MLLWFLEGLERRAYFILSEAQKKDERFFEGIVFLCKRWNNDKSIIEKHRHSAPPVDIGISYPPKDEVMEMLGMASHDHHSRKRRRRKTKKVTTTQPAANTSPLNSSQRASSG